MTRRIYIDDGAQTSAFDLMDETTYVGRDPSCQIFLDTNQVSRRHLKLTLTGDDLIAEDLGSSNGTSINDVEMTHKVIVHPGDVLSVGDIKLHVDLVKPVVTSVGPRRAERTAARPSRLPVVAGVVVVAIVGFVFLRGGGEDESSPKLDQSIIEATTTRTSTSQPTGSADSGTHTASTDGARLAELELRVREFMLRDAYRDAMVAIDAFERGTRRGSAAEIRQDVDRAATMAASKTVAEIDRLIVAEQSSVAAALLKERLANVAETGSAYAMLIDAQRRIERATPKLSEATRISSPTASSSVGGSTQPPAGAAISGAGEAQAQRKTTLETTRAEALELVARGREEMKNRSWAVAAATFDDAALKAKDGAMGPETLAECARQARIARRLVEFADMLTKVVSAQPDRYKPVPVMPSRTASVVGAYENGLVFDLDGQRTEFAWRVLRADAVAALIRQCEFDVQGKRLAATFLLANGEEAAGHRMLREAENGADETAKRALDLVLADAFGSDIPDGGFIWEVDRYLSPRDLKRIRDAETLKSALAVLGSDDLTKRQEAYAALAGLGEGGKSAFHRGLVSAKGEIIKRLEKQGVYKRLEDMHALRLSLDEARKSALDLIFDEEKYPYPYRDRGPEIASIYAETQKEIDNRVAALKKIWDDQRKVGLTGELRGLVDRLNEINLWMAKLELGFGSVDPVCVKFLPPGDTVTIQNYALDAQEREDIDRSAAWMISNDLGNNIAAVGERTEVRLTNLYRTMMGRHAVIIDDKLTTCARGHSEDMSRLGFFAHENPFEPEKRRPWDRARLAGFAGGGVSENIAKAGGAQSAHNSWLHSSGHHRNILGRSWRSLGVGQSGNNWTQNFAGTVSATESAVTEGRAER